MTRFDSPIKDAIGAAQSDRLISLVYSVLNNVAGSKEQKKEWREPRTRYVVQARINSARPNGESYPDASWVDPWTARQLRSCVPHGPYYIVEECPAGLALAERIRDDPRVEDWEVRHLEQLLSTPNRNISEP